MRRAFAGGRPRVGIAAKLAGVLALSALGALSLSAALEYDAGRRLLARELDTTLREAVDRLAVGLRLPLDEFADATVCDIARAELADGDVASVSVWRGPDRETFVCGFVRRAGTVERVDAPLSPPDDALLDERVLRSGGPAGDGRVTGSVLVAIDTRGPRGRLLVAVARQFGALALAVVLVMGLLAMIVGRALVAPLEALRRRMLDVESAGFAESAVAPDLRHGFSEIREIGDAFQRMLAVLAARERELVTSARSLREEERRYRELAELLPLAVFEADAAGRLRFANHSAVEVFGYEPADIAAGLDALLLVAPTDRERAARDMASVEAGPGEYTMLCKDGRAFPAVVYAAPVVDEAGAAVGLRGVVVDDTARRTEEGKRLELEARLAAAQRLESIGVLAGGIAHDFNNILTPIIGHTEILQISLPSDREVQEDLQTVLEAARRGASLTHQILAFSRRQHLEFSELDVNVEVAATLKMLRRLIGEDIELRTRLEPSLASVHADRTQVQQVLLNLAVNARDAMPDGGVLGIETRNVVLDERGAWTHSDLPPGRYVLVEVTDDGCGMTPETLRRAFEPFYTTKGPGRGTGLGLATVHGIVKQHRGDITVYSELEHGTTFRIYLPALDGDAAVEAPRDVDDMVCGSGTILVVEDESSVRALARRVLGRLGYSVLEAECGAAALGVASHHEGPIDLLLTDVVLPGMNGREIHDELTRLRPGLPVLYMSGYPALSGSLATLLQSGAPFLPKPFALRALSVKVAEVLRASRP